MALDQITTGIIKDDAVTTAKILNDNITAAKIVAGAVIADVAADSVTASHLANDAVGTTQLANDAVTADKLANSINTDIATGVAALPKAGGTMTGNLTLSNANPVIDMTSGNASIKAEDSLTFMMDSNDENAGGETISFKTDSATTAMTIKEGGQVGIGTAAPSSPLHIGGLGNDDAIAFDNGASLNTHIACGFSSGDNNVMSQRFYTRGTERFRVTNAGNCWADLAFSDDSLDFAEYFEWADGNPDDEYRAGESVVLVEGKIRIATSDDDADSIIGVISETPCFIGNAANGKWSKKYVTDDFGKREWKLVDGLTTETINPDWDETQEYTNREERKEWGIVGLLGQIAIKKLSPKKSNWIKLKDVSDTVEQWLVR